MSFPLFHPVYTRGSCRNAQDAINKIIDCFEEYRSDKKYVNFVGMPHSDLLSVQCHFVQTHRITCVGGSPQSGYYTVRPIFNL